MRKIGYWLCFLNKIQQASKGYKKNIHYSWSYDIQNQVLYLFTVVTTELYTRGKLQSSVDSFHCQHLHIWFAGIRKVCVCLHRFIVLLLCKTLWWWPIRIIHILNRFIDHVTNSVYLATIWHWSYKSIKLSDVGTKPHSHIHTQNFPYLQDLAALNAFNNHLYWCLCNNTQNIW